TDSLLKEKETALVLIITDTANMGSEVLERLLPLVRESNRQGRPYYAISALAADSVHKVLLGNGIDMPVYLADRKTLLTMVRSSPGLVVLKQGVVLAKFAFRDIPSPEKWDKITTQDPELLIAGTRIKTRLRVQFFIAALLLLIFLLKKGFWLSRSRL
ncbi:hypothetical protein SMA90_26790, partial [Escherichia coli]